MNTKGTKFISAYDFQADSWVECKGVQLLLAVFRLDLVEVVVAGETTNLLYVFILDF